MNTSSVQVDYLTQSQIDTLSDTITLTPSGSSYSSSDTITIDSSVWSNMGNVTGSIGSSCYTSGTGSYTIGGGLGGTGSTCYTVSGGGAGVGSICITNISGIDIGTMFGEEWKTKFPDFSRIQEMCKEYPGLQIAFEKFKTVYNLVKDDYDTPKDQRKRP